MATQKAFTLPERKTKQKPKRRVWHGGPSALQSTKRWPPPACGPVLLPPLPHPQVQRQPQHGLQAGTCTHTPTYTQTHTHAGDPKPPENGAQGRASKRARACSRVPQAHRDPRPRQPLSSFLSVQCVSFLVGAHGRGP